MSLNQRMIPHSAGFLFGFSKYQHLCLTQIHSMILLSNNMEPLLGANVVDVTVRC